MYTVYKVLLIVKVRQIVYIILRETKSVFKLECASMYGLLKRF